jgi:hypothetical protein
MITRISVNCDLGDAPEITACPSGDRAILLRFDKDLAVYLNESQADETILKLSNAVTELQKRFKQEPTTSSQVAALTSQEGGAR